MAKYLEKVQKNLERFNYFKIEHIPREQNSNIDALAKLASQNDLDELNLVMVEMLSKAYLFPLYCFLESVSQFSKESCGIGDLLRHRNPKSLRYAALDDHKTHAV
uniref:RNase H type-1 domain-containing protein n=1 Tax=Cannabis sativa TaxID=3483 RepID=A0A803QYV6_CANSA